MATLTVAISPPDALSEAHLGTGRTARFKLNRMRTPRHRPPWITKHYRWRKSSKSFRRLATCCASRIPSVGWRVRALQEAGKSADIAGSVSAGTLDSSRISAAALGMLHLSSRVGHSPRLRRHRVPIMWSGRRAAGADRMSADSHLVRRMTPPGTRR